MNRIQIGLTVGLIWAGTVLLIPESLHAQSTYYVATGGSDLTGNGSSGTPWATITHAVNTVPDNSTILVKPGTYTGQVRLDRVFAQGITVRSETPYQARLRYNAGQVVRQHRV